MSSNCPPQLQLTTPTTNFKRSFEQLVGFDLDSPVGGQGDPHRHHHHLHHLSGSDGGDAGDGRAGGNDRNKRARSSSAEDTASLVSGVPLRSGSASSSSSSSSGSSLIGASRRRANERGSSSASSSSASSSSPFVVVPGPGSNHQQQDPPPRLPTPMIQDIEMSDYSPIEGPSVSASSASITGQLPHPQPSSEELYRLSLERFNAFESEISVLRRTPPSASNSLQSHAPPSSSASAPMITLPLPLARPPTPPPTLPPLSIVSSSSPSSTPVSNQNHAHSHTLPANPFFHPAPRPSTPLESLFSFESPSSTRVDSPAAIGQRGTRATFERESQQPPQQQQHQQQQQQYQQGDGQGNASNLQETPHDSAFHFHDPHFPSALRNPFVLPLSFSSSHSQPQLQPQPQVQTQTQNPPRPHFHMDRHRHQTGASLSQSINRTRDEIRRFRERLDTALERLRPDSPLVPGLEVQGVGNGVEGGGQGEVDDDEEDEEDENLSEDEEERGEDEEEDEDEDEDEEGNEDEDEDEDELEEEDDEDENIPPASQPPTLPPIPPISSTDIDAEVVQHWTATATASSSASHAPYLENHSHELRPNTMAGRQSQAQQAQQQQLQQAQAQERQQGEQRRRSISPPTLRLHESTSTSASANANRSLLGDHPLPSPILRDLHSWMEERGSGGSSSSGVALEEGGSTGPQYVHVPLRLQHQQQHEHHPQQHRQQQQQQQFELHMPHHQRPSSATSRSDGDSVADEWAFYDNLNMFTASLSGGSGAPAASAAAGDENRTTSAAPAAAAAASTPSLSTSTAAAMSPSNAAFPLSTRSTPQPATFGSASGGAHGRVGANANANVASSSSSSSFASASALNTASNTASASSSSSLFASPAPGTVPGTGTAGAYQYHHQSADGNVGSPGGGYDRPGHFSFMRRSPPSSLWRSQQHEHGHGHGPDNHENQSRPQDRVHEESDFTYASLLATTGSPSADRSADINTPNANTANDTVVTSTPTSTAAQGSFSSFLSLDSLFGPPTPPVDSTSSATSMTRPLAGVTPSTSPVHFSHLRFRSTPLDSASASTAAEATTTSTPSASNVASASSSAGGNSNSSLSLNLSSISSSQQQMTRISPPEPMSPLWPFDPPPPSSWSLGSTSSTQQQHQRSFSPSPFTSTSSSGPAPSRSRSLRTMPSFSSTRFGSSTSLVSENAAEVRRRADHAEMVMRDRERERVNSNATRSLHSRTHTLGEFINERLRDLNDRVEASDSLPAGQPSGDPSERARMLYHAEEEGSGQGAPASAQSSPGLPTSSRETDRDGDRDSVLDSSILGRRGRWGLPMLSSSSATAGPTSAASQSNNNHAIAGGEIDIFGTSQNFHVNPPSPLSLSFTGAVQSPPTNSAAADGGNVTTTASAQTGVSRPLDSSEIEFLGSWSLYGGQTGQTSTSSANLSGPSNSPSTSAWPGAAAQFTPLTAPNPLSTRPSTRRLSFSLDVMEGIVDSSSRTPDENMTGNGTEMFIPSRVPPTLPPPDLGGNLAGAFDTEQHPGHVHSPTAAVGNTTSDLSSMQDVDMRYDNPLSSHPSRRSSGSADDSDDMDIEFSVWRPENLSSSRHLSPLEQHPLGTRASDLSNEMPPHVARFTRDRRLVDRLRPEERVRADRESQRVREGWEMFEAERLRQRAALRLRAAHAQAQELADALERNPSRSVWSSSSSASQTRDRPLFSSMRAREDSLERLRRVRAQLLAERGRGDNDSHSNNSNSNSPTSPAPMAGAQESLPSSDRDRRQQSFADFDPQSFTPGPFRNTMMHYRNTMNSQAVSSSQPPPSIPPLSFGDSRLLRDRSAGGMSRHLDSRSSAGFDSLTQPSTNETATSSAATSTRPSGPRNPSIQPTRVLPRSFASARAASQLSSGNMNNENNVSRGGATAGRADLHNFMSRHVRMESSRVDDLGGSSSASPIPRNTRNGTLGAGERGLPRQSTGDAESLRSDDNAIARHAQLFEQFQQFRRERELLRVRDSEGLGTSHLNSYRPQHLVQARRPFVPVYARRGSLFGLGFEELVDLSSEERDADDSSNRNSSTVNPTSSTASTRRRRAEVIDLSEDETSQTDTSTPAITTASRRRFVRMHPPEMMMFTRGFRGGRAMGDFMRDEDFDDSYESLLSLSQTLGDAKPRSTPNEIIEKMEKAEYKDWATPDSDKRCPICLDDYGQTDTVLKLPNCTHWLHQDCLHQWLTNANTCPVCRKSATSSSSSSTGPSAARIGPRAAHHHHHHIHPLRPHLAQHMPVSSTVPPHPSSHPQNPPNSFGARIFRRSSLLGTRATTLTGNNTDNRRGQSSSHTGQNSAGQSSSNEAGSGNTNPGDAPSRNFW